MNYNHGVVVCELSETLVRQHLDAVAKGIVQCPVCEANKALTVTP
jgi:hypothetical protein